jgi:hypothetical protein
MPPFGLDMRSELNDQSVRLPSPAYMRCSRTEIWNVDVLVRAAPRRAVNMCALKCMHVM